MFNFRLQRVLDLREQKEQELASALAAARAEAEAALLRCRALEARCDAERQAIAQTATSAQVAGYLQNAAFVIECLEDRLAIARREAQEAEAQAERLQAAFTEAFRDRRVMSKLRDRRQDEHRVHTVRTEQNVMDDIATSRFVRQPAGFKE